MTESLRAKWDALLKPALESVVSSLALDPLLVVLPGGGGAGGDQQAAAASLLQ